MNAASGGFKAALKMDGSNGTSGQCYRFTVGEHAGNLPRSDQHFVDQVKKKSRRVSETNSTYQNEYFISVQQIFALNHGP